ncbi:hypothetical protein ES708_27725 [subsurface metagenome]
MKGLEIKGYFTIVENEILDLLLILKLTKHEIKIMLAGVRVLNGFDKEKDRIPLSNFKILTGMSRGDCSVAINSLIKKKMLYKNEGKLGINRDFKKWEGVSDSLTGKVLAKWLSWVSDSHKKGVSDSRTSKQKEKQNSKQRSLGYKKLSGKEINKLEGDQWYKAIMFNKGKFSIFYIQGTIDDFPFNTRMSCWYSYQEATNVKNKEAFFSHLLKNYQEDLKE